MRRVRLEYRGYVDGEQRIVYEGVVLREADTYIIMDIQKVYLDGELHRTNNNISLQQIEVSGIAKIRYVDEEVEGGPECTQKALRD